LKEKKKMDDDFRAGVDCVYFARKYLKFDPDPVQISVLREVLQGTQLMINCCRQWGKSTICALKALHQAIYYPDQMILLLSPSQRQSMELFRKVLDFANKLPWLNRSEDTKQHMALDNGSRIVSLPGSEHTVRGYSNVNLIVVDEASRVIDDFYYMVRPMLAVSGGSIFLLSTPFGKRGFFYKEYQRKGWKKLRVSVDDCPRIPASFIKNERAGGTPEWFIKQEYFCSFEENQDSVFDADLVNEMFKGCENIKPLFQRGGDDLIDPNIKPLEV
jgi:hypothetical protein